MHVLIYVTRFRWVACQLDSLRNCLNLSGLQKALASLPGTLDDTYTRILCNIDEEHSEYAFKILQRLTYSARPLELEEVAETIAIDVKGNPRVNPENRFPEPRDIFSICSSLISLESQTSGDNDSVIVGLAHFSVKEYLVSERILQGKARRYSIQENSANISIYNDCLAYLLDLDEPNPSSYQLLAEYPLARYAAKYWIQHAQVAQKDINFDPFLVIELFLVKENGLLIWIRLYDPEFPWEEPYIVRDSRNICHPLYYASIAGLHQCARMLLDKGIDVNVQGGRLGNALQAASYLGHDQIMQMLLDAGADVNAQGGIFGNALQAAVATYRGHEQGMQMLLDKGIDVDTHGGMYGNALQTAAASRYKNDQIVQTLLDEGADVNAQGGYYGNALQAAIYHGHNQMVQMLLNKGADVNAQGNFGSALQAASFEGRYRMVRMLLEKEAKVNTQEGLYSNALQAALYKGHVNVVHLLLDSGANLESKDTQGRVPIHLASAGGHVKSLELLSSFGLDWTTTDTQGRGCLHHASSSGSAESVGWLLTKGLDATGADRDGWTPLHWAARSGSFDTVRVLKAAGAISTTESIEGWTPDLIARFHHKQLSVVSKTVTLDKYQMSELRMESSFSSVAAKVESRNDEQVFSPGIRQKGFICNGCLLVSFDLNNCFLLFF